MTIPVNEAGPRDGPHSIKRSMATEIKLRKALADAGPREIEAVPLMNPKLLPQMADAADVVLAPDRKGVQRAAGAGAHKITMPVSASGAHSKAHFQMAGQALRLIPACEVVQ
jgi:hydroxymethylglutaryl-CoA lyase